MLAPALFMRKTSHSSKLWRSHFQERTAPTLCSPRRIAMRLRNRTRASSGLAGLLKSKRKGPFSMSQRLINLSPDLKRLRDEGYFIQIRGGLLVMRDVPYVDSKREVRLGTLISTLTVAGEVTRTPDTHVVYFDGEFPCSSDGQRLMQIAHQS